MYGLAAIQQAEGWAMAGAGACIVLSGLTVLSFLISLLPRLTSLFEAKPAKKPPEEAPEPKTIVPETVPTDMNAGAALYQSLTEEMGETFTLMDLHKISKALDLPHPHLSINRFREAGLLVAKGEGLFSWQSASEETTKD
jgi:hypothetical protein